MDRIFLIKRLDESRDPYSVVLYNLLEYKSSKHDKPVEITYYFEGWQHPTQQEVEYFHMIYGDLVLEAFTSFLGTFREALKRIMEGKESYERNKDSLWN